MKALATRRGGALLAALVLAVLPGCGPRFVRETVFQEGEIVARVRWQRQGGDPVERGFAHPVTISPVRLAHILSNVDVRFEKTEEDERQLAIPTELLYPIGEALARGLARADSSQEVVVTAVRRERRLGIFTRRFLTGLVAYVESENLVLHLSHLDWEVPRGEKDELPEPWANRPRMGFRVLSAEGITPAGPQALTVTWRDPRFRSPRSLRVGPTGRVLRRTILMESAPEPAAPQGGAGVEDALDPATLRALADLEEARRRGELTEAEYQARRRELLGGEPEPASNPP